MNLTHSDFEHLCDNGMSWKTIDWEKQEDRFEVVNGKYDDPINWEFRHAYWLGEDYSHVILAREYLRNIGYTDHQVLWDMADNTSDVWLHELSRLAHAVVGEGPYPEPNARHTALVELVESVRRKNHSYVILTNFTPPRKG